MRPEVILWIFGALIGVLSTVIAWLASRQNEQGREIAGMRQHVAENYVRTSELVKVENAVAQLSDKVDKLLIAVHQLIGKHSS